MTRIVWQYVDWTDPHDSGWWVLARLMVRDDGALMIETNTRGSVVATDLILDADAAAKLRETVDREVNP